jgi:hypothetical protein
MRFGRRALPLLVLLAVPSLFPQAVTHKCGTLAPVETWVAADGPFVLDCQVFVPSGGLLTIEPGTIVKSTEVYFYGLQVDGTLSADGGTLPADRIIFTSLLDDSAGGDTNGDGNTSPNRGGWGGIFFTDGSHGNLRNVSVRYGGGYSWSLTAAQAGLTSASRDLTIADSEFSFSSSQAIYLTPTASQVNTIRSSVAHDNPINGLFVAGGAGPMSEPTGTWESSLPYVLGGTARSWRTAGPIRRIRSCSPPSSTTPRVETPTTTAAHRLIPGTGEGSTSTPAARCL